ncbi:MAG: NAD/FAD-utilizing enzyme [Halioglobus sp.]|nr:NAD/FAD-utilizing enzyme [Halioglobus sp.]
MKRHYYISDDLDDLEVIEKQLEAAGVSTPQIHVLSEDDAGLEEHHLHKVEAVLKKDVVHGTELGAVVGVIGAAAVLAVAYYSGLTETYTWVPAIFLAIIILGFCTWEGGLIGIQNPHVDFRRFQDDLDAGKHILFVDVDPEQESILQGVVSEHPKLQDAGEGASTPRMVVMAQNFFPRSMWRVKAR